MNKRKIMARQKKIGKIWIRIYFFYINVYKTHSWIHRVRSSGKMHTFSIPQPFPCLCPSILECSLPQLAPTHLSKPGSSSVSSPISYSSKQFQTQVIPLPTVTLTLFYSALYFSLLLAWLHLQATLRPRPAQTLIKFLLQG